MPFVAWLMQGALDWDAAIDIHVLVTHRAPPSISRPLFFFYFRARMPSRRTVRKSEVLSRLYFGYLLGHFTFFIHRATLSHVSVDETAAS
jgi:hypothetical protein